MVYLIFLCIALPLLLMLPILEGRSRRLIGFLLLGLTTALAGFELNTMLFAWSGLDTIQFPLIVTPMTEEVLKALPVGVYAILLCGDRKDVLPIAMSVGIGFSILENTVILMQNIGLVTLGWAALRGLSASLMHGLCTMVIGAGLPYVKQYQKLFYTGIFGLWAIAATMHAIFNLLIQSAYGWLGACLPMACYGLLFLVRRSGKLKLPFLSY